MSAPLDTQSAQQALELLEKVQTKVLVEMWITIMLVGGCLSVVLGEIVKLLGLPRFNSVFVVAYGYTMTWVPATAAIWLGYAAMVLGVANFVKQTLSVKAATKAHS